MLIHLFPSLAPSPQKDGMVFFNNSDLFVPTSEAEMVDIVKRAGRERRKIRVVGSGHSWSAVATSQDILVSLSNYRGTCMCSPPSPLPRPFASTPPISEYRTCACV